MHRSYLFAIREYDREFPESRPFAACSPGLINCDSLHACTAGERSVHACSLLGRRASLQEAAMHKSILHACIDRQVCRACACMQCPL